MVLNYTQGQLLQFVPCQKFDCIEGLAQVGSQGRPCSIANHILVFMVCVCVSRGRTKAEIIGEFLERFLIVLMPVGMRDCRLPLSVIWVPTVSRL
jgi:hypothetical protein